MERIQEITDAARRRMDHARTPEEVLAIDEEYYRNLRQAYDSLITEAAVALRETRAQ